MEYENDTAPATFTKGYCWYGKAVGSGKPRTITHVFEGKSLGRYEIKSRLHSSDGDPSPFLAVSCTTCADYFTKPHVCAGSKQQIAQLGIQQPESQAISGPNTGLCNSRYLAYRQMRKHVIIEMSLDYKK